ncbi:MAG: flavin reductase family protein [Streptosporangiales bacterium]|nr:flavin reductase family protein [Streptosporangiales bacterium]
MILRNPGELENLASYKLLTGAMVPRPIAFVSTVGADGVENIAPFSWNTVVSTDPPMLAFTTFRLPGRLHDKEDTLRNVQDTGEFVYNIVTYDIEQKMVDTSADWAPEVDEFTQCGLTAVPSTAVKAPRLAESPVSFECTLERVIECGGGETHLVIGQVIAIDVVDELIVDGRLDMSSVARTGRMAGTQYVRTNDVLVLGAAAAGTRQRAYATDYLFDV